MRNKLIAAIVTSGCVLGLYTYAFAQGASGLSYRNAQSAPATTSLQQQIGTPESSSDIVQWHKNGQSIMRFDKS